MYAKGGAASELYYTSRDYKINIRLITMRSQPNCFEVVVVVVVIVVVVVDGGFVIVVVLDVDCVV